MFDDFANLPALGAYGRIDNLESFLLYLTSGIAGPTGRPLSLLSFLIDANNWPAEPRSFKYTNVLIHLLNGALLCWLSIRIARALGYAREHAQWIGLLSAGLWLLHPFWVSTTLYVVQRMTLLAATFMLAGLLAYVHGRRRLDTGHTGGYVWMTAGITLGTLLATLSKENGALLPLLALVVEWLVLAPATKARQAGPVPRTLTAWRWTFLALPACLVLGYLVYLLPENIFATLNTRDFSIWERVLTEWRVMVDYIAALYLPQPFTSALFHDNIQLSTGLLSPWTTLAAGLFLVALLALGWFFRKRFPPLALAIFFFFAGHLMESTIVALELYFEHRNYAPAMFAFFPLAVLIVSVGQWRWAPRVAIALVALALLTSMTYARSNVWGEPNKQAVVWVQQNPSSPRALTYAALSQEQAGHYTAASRLLAAAERVAPHSAMVALNQLTLACETRTLTPAIIQQARQALRHDKRAEQLAFNIISDLIATLGTGYCPAMDSERIKRLIAAALANPAIANTPGRRQSMLQLYGVLALRQHQPSEAYQYFVRALKARPRADVALMQAARLGTTDRPCRALAILELYQTLKPTISQPSGLDMATVHAWVLEWLNYYQEEIARIRGVLRQDARQLGMTCHLASKSHKTGDA